MTDVVDLASLPSRSPAGWYLDPTIGALRWWDGQVWTDQVVASPAAIPGRHAHARPVDVGRHVVAGPPPTVTVRRVAEGVATTLVLLVIVLTVMTMRHEWSSQDAVALPGDSGSATGPSGPQDVVLLAQRSSHGAGAVGPFTTQGPWQLQYSVDCGNVGKASPFVITDVVDVLVREHARTASKVVQVTRTGTQTLAVATACGWVVRVFGTGASPTP
jgi:hypothetical protein